MPPAYMQQLDTQHRLGKRLSLILYSHTTRGHSVTSLEEQDALIFHRLAIVPSIRALLSHDLLSVLIDSLIIMSYAVAYALILQDSQTRSFPFSSMVSDAFIGT